MKSITIQEYNNLAIRGIEATQTVQGKERGGFVLCGKFYFCGATNYGIFEVEAKDWTSSVDINSGNGRLA